MYEEDARNIFRKWDNVKRICEKIKDRRVPKSPMMPECGDRSCD